MLCPNCGAQNPDTSAFCEKCGSPLSAQPMGQPMGQPAYAAPVYSQPVAKKSKTVPIVIGVCAAAVAAFLVILFTVILPAAGGIEGKLKHKWTATDAATGITVTYDFKNDVVSTFGIEIPITWELKGDDRLTVEMSMLGTTQSMEYIFSLSSNGKTLTLAEASSPSDTQDFQRAD